MASVWNRTEEKRGLKMITAFKAVKVSQSIVQPLGLFSAYDA